MLRGQINANLPTEHPIITIWNNRIQNARHIGKKVYWHNRKREKIFIKGGEFTKVCPVWGSNSRPSDFWFRLWDWRAAYCANEAPVRVASKLSMIDFISGNTLTGFQSDLFSVEFWIQRAAFTLHSAGDALLYTGHLITGSPSSFYEPHKEHNMRRIIRVCMGFSKWEKFKKSAPCEDRTHDLQISDSDYETDALPTALTRHL